MGGRTPPEGRDTPVTFSREEVAQIRELMGTPGATLVCPQCGGDLTVGAPVAGGGSVGPVWPVRCGACRRIAVVREVPGGRRPLSGGS